MDRIWIGVSLIACAATCSCARQTPTSPAPPAAGATNVVIVDIAEINGPYSFFPSPATFKAGQTVLWRNDDGVTHHVQFDDRSIDTGTLAPGTLSQPMNVRVGTYPYHCTIHPSMVGTITVAAGQAGPGS